MGHSFFLRANWDGSAQWQLSEEISSDQSLGPDSPSSGSDPANLVQVVSLIRWKPSYKLQDSTNTIKLCHNPSISERDKLFVVPDNVATLSFKRVVIWLLLLEMLL